MKAITIRAVDEQDQVWIETLLVDHWGSTEIVSRGKVLNAERLPAFLAELGGERMGLLTFHIVEGDCEIVTLNSLSEGSGLGKALLQAVEAEAREKRCKRLWLITTNDNVDALRFYQKLGFHLAALYPNAIERFREFKPQIPLIGHYGIPIRDEIELHRML
jgi:ribosomal protein S18 acetylase RimI-like enzyme